MNTGQKGIAILIAGVCTIALVGGLLVLDRGDGGASGTADVGGAGQARSDEQQIPPTTQTPPTTRKVTGSYYFPDFAIHRQYEEADAVVVGVVEQLIAPVRNQLGSRQTNPEAEPIFYEGFTLSVEEWFGGGRPTKSITVYHMASGRVTINGRSLHLDAELIPQVSIGQRLIVPLRDGNVYGVPLADNEYWAISNGRGIFELGPKGASRLVPMGEIAPASADVKDSLSVDQLLGAVAKAGHSARHLQ